MKNPFPGMNPYLQAHWPDIHTRLIAYLADAINEKLPPGLQARAQEGLTVGVDEDLRTIYPDVKVVEFNDDDAALDFEDDYNSGNDGGVAVMDAVTVSIPKRIKVPRGTLTERWLEIIDLDAQERIVTTIEILSPANKRSPGKEAFRQKQGECIAAGINLVEIDLIRGGDFVLTAPEAEVPIKYREPYRICIRRLRRPTTAEFFRATFREPLPNIPIPLRAKDRDIVVSLQPLIEDVIRKGRYTHINYQMPLSDPPLSEADEQWMDSLLKEAGLRK